VLRDLGYGEGVAIFEAAVARWHGEADPYPYIAPCPDCEPSVALPLEETCE
jgi:CelD/BcsL family acetyltransferase involved in cellulose biosynthesis